MSDFIGSLVTKANTAPTVTSASGRWTVTEVAKYTAKGTWPASITPDPYFNYTTLLLPGNGNNGGQNNTIIAESNFAPSGVGSYAGYFDGVGDYVSVADNNVLDLSGDFTIECWLYRIPRTGEGVNRFLSKGNYQGGAGEWIMYIDSSTGGLGMAWGTGTDALGIGSMSSYQWTHIAVTRSGTTVRTFVNGSLVTTITVSVDFTSAAPVYIGADEAVPANAQWSGYISNVRIVKGTALYTASFSVPTSPLTAVAGTSLLTCNSATFADNSGNALTVTAVGNAAVATVSAPTITRSGNTTQGSFNPYGNYWSNYFDGIGDYLTVPDNSAFEFGTGDFTLEAWVFLTAYTSSYSGLYTVDILSKDSNTSRGFVFRLLGTATSYTTIEILLFSSNSTFAAIQGSATITLNTWNHIAFTRSSGVAKVFFNGEQLVSTADSTNIQDTTASVFIGGSEFTGYAAYFPGYISNLRIVKGTSVYNSTFTPPTTPLTAISGTSLLTCQSNRFIDNSSNNFAITRSGDVKVRPNSPFAPSAIYQSASGASAYFDGTTDNLVIPASTLNVFNGNFTMECWYYLSNTTWTEFSLYLQGASPFFAININTGGYRIYLNSATSNITTSTVIQSGCWNHVALVKSGPTVTVYHNGISVGAASTSAVLGYSTNANLRIDGTSGYISDFRVLNGTASFTAPPTSPLTAVSSTTELLNFKNASIVDATAKTDLETAGNAQISTTVKKFGTGSMSFDGTGDYLSIPNTPDINITTGDFTIEGWFYFNSVATGQHIFINYTSTSNYGIALYTSATGTLSYYLGSNGTSWNIASAVLIGSISVGQWYHVAFVRSGSTFTPYLNGVAGTTTTSSSALFNNGTVPYILGGNPSGGYFNGYIDDFRVTKGIARYTGNFTVPTGPYPTR